MFKYSPEEDIKYTSGENPRLDIRQLNLWQPLQILKIDKRIFISPILLNLSTSKDYLEETNEERIDELNSFIEYVTNEKSGGV